MRSRMRGKDTLGRFSGNKFGIVLRDCTPDDMAIAAERLLAGVRDEMVPTSAGPIAVTVTIGGVTAPRHARSVAEVLARAQETLDAAKSPAPRLVPGLSAQYRARSACGARTCAPPTRSSPRSTSGASSSPTRPWSRPPTGKPAFYECLMRIRRTDGSLVAANEIIPVAERLGLVRLLDHRVLELVVDELIGAPALQASLNVSPASTTDPDWWAGLARCCARIPASPSASSSRSPKAPPSTTSTRRAASSPASRISAAASPSTISAPATRRSAICASSASISSRSTAPSCRTSCARKTIAPSCAR